jgi:hypothetical protein
MKLTTGFVYNIRSSSSSAPKENGNGSRTSRGAAKVQSAESVLRGAIAQIGLARAREILEEVEDTFAGL